MSHLTYQPKIYKTDGGDQLVVASGGTINVASGGSLKFNGTPANEVTLTLDIGDASAEAVYYLVCPHAGAIKKIWSVIDSAVLTADVTVTAAIGATGVTNGVITIATAASAAGDIDSATPTAANVVTAGQAINFTVTGGGSAGTGPRIHLSVVIAR